VIRQLAFDLPAREAFRREDFFVSPANAVALAAVDGWQGWPGGKMLLVGPKGSGKTHLARLWAAEAGAAVIPGADLAGADLPGLSAHGAVAVEDAEAVAGHADREAAFFHLHNLVVQAGSLLVTAKTPPRDWGLGLPDLASRLQAAPLTPLGRPRRRAAFRRSGETLFRPPDRGAAEPDPLHGPAHGTLAQHRAPTGCRP